MVDRNRRQAIVQEQAQQAIAMVAAVDLVAMTEKKTSSLYGNDRRPGVNLRSESLIEDCPHVEIMVAFEVHQAASAMHERFKRGQNCIEFTERI